jgi:hypothetical protein
MKTFYYELNEDNRILWIDEVDRLNMIDSTIVSPTIKLETIEHINIWWDKIINGKFVQGDFEELDTSEQDLKAELLFIQQWFIDNDWIPNKIITGEWETTDPRWIEYLSERQIKRTRQDEIKNFLEV